MKANGFISLILVLSFLIPNFGGGSASQNISPSINSKITFQDLLKGFNTWMDSLKVITFEVNTNLVNDIQPTETATPSISLQPTAGPTLSPTLAPTLTPTLAPMEVISSTVEPSLDTQLSLANLDITLDPDPATAGDVITAIWSIKNYRGQFDGMEIYAYLPEAFVPVEIGDGSFDPNTNLMIMPIHGPNGWLSLYIDANAQPPYTILVEIHLNGRVILSVTRQLGQRGPDFVPVEGGEAHGFNRHVKVSFTGGALPEAADIFVRAPLDKEHSLGGQPMELTAIGRDSKREIHQFNQPITITVQYTDEDAQRQLKHAGMSDESSLTLFYYDEAQGTWYPLETSVDTEAHRLTATTNHFTLFDYKAQNWEAARLPTLEGFQVAGFTGAATYSYPIQVPPGPGGLQPNLELSYNSQVVDSASSRTQASWVGMGWSLDTGYIQRNMNGTPDYLGDDTFNLVLNGVGGLLLPIADQDGDPNTIDYHFASERFWRIRQYLATGDVYGYQGDHSRWVVFAPDGRQYYFGDSDGMGGHAWYMVYPQNCSVSMQTWKWGLTKERNIFGKELTYTYNSELSPNPKYSDRCQGNPATIFEALYPDSIIYANNHYRIVFIREGGSGIGSRTDYDNAWESPYSTVFYMRAKLLRVEVWHDPNGNWHSGDEILIRKYVLGYGENGQQIYPGLRWPVYQGKTPTLTSITEYGLNGTNQLPKNEFTYDGMHLATVKNGYGGTVNLSYDAWHANNGFERFREEATIYLRGEYYPDSLSPYGDDLKWLQTLFNPGTSYMIVVAIWTDAGNSWVKLGLDDGTAHVYGGQINLTPGQWNIVTDYVSISKNANQARALINCKDDCHFNSYRVYPVVSRYRTSSKIITDEVTSASYATNYAYEGAAVNDLVTSLYVYNYQDGYRLMTKPYTEFRGHSHVTETDPDGKVVESWYFQNDVYKGMLDHNRVRDGAGNKYTETYNSYTFADYTYVPGLPFPQNQSYDFYQDLKILWVYPTSSENRSYNGDSSYVATKDDYLYYGMDQNNSQYGNRTRTISYSWDGSGWYAYRGTRSGYIPTVTNGNGNPVNSRYLTGLPAYYNTYKCEGNCDWSALQAMSSKWYLYDTNTMYNVAPIDGVLAGNRILIVYLTPPRTDPRYSDTKYTYDTWGNQTSITRYTGMTDMVSFGSGSGAQTSYTCYGGGGTLGGTACIDDGYHSYLLWERDALGHPTSYTYDLTKSVPLSVSDPNDSDYNDTTINATYDDFGRINSIIRPGDDSTNQTMRMGYHTASAPFFNNPFWTEVQQKISGGTYFVLRKYYNGIGQLLQTQVVGASIGSQTRDLLTDRYYDAAGRVAQQSVTYDVTTGSNFQGRDTGRAHTSYAYDVLGRTLTIIATDGAGITGYQYWDGYIGNVPYVYTKVTNPRNYDTTTRSDVWGRVVNITSPTGPDVTYTYDEEDRLLTTSRGGSGTTINYDFGGRKISMGDPDMGSWSYSYDAVGNLTKQTDAKAQGICMYYDALNRLQGKQYYNNNPCPTWYDATNMNVRYWYDDYTDATIFAGYTGSTINSIGRRTGMTDSSGRSMWTYDNRGRTIREQKVITGSGTFKTQWGYNSADLVSSMTYPASNDGSSGEVVNFAYLSQMVLDTVIGTTTYVKNTDYDAAGRVDLRDLGVSGSNPVMRVDYTYFNWTDVNGQGRLKQITSGIWSNLTSLQDLRYTYDANGNVLTIQDYKSGNPQTQTFTYDSLDRLTSAIASGGSGGKYTIQNYTYDGTTGNLSSMAGVNYTYGDGNHKHAVTQMGSNMFSYDANGNQTNRTVGGSSYTLSYDAENRLVSVSGAATASFVYDGDGNRVKGTIGTTTTTYIGNYFEWKTSTSDMVKYYYAGSTRVAMRTGSSTLNYLLGDHLGSQAITTNSNGSKTAEIRYYPWGTERYTSSTTPTTYHFTGQRLESSIGLYYYGARWYDPLAGRFIQADSVVPIEASNLKIEKQMQLTLIVDYHENDLLTRLNKMYQENLTVSVKEGNEHNKEKDLLDSIKNSKKNKDDIQNNHKNESDIDSEIQALVYLNGIKNIGKTNTNNYQDNRGNRDVIGDPSYVTPLLVNTIRLDRFAYTSNCPTSYTDPSGHCDMTKAIGSGAGVFFGGVMFVLGLGLFVVGMGEAGATSPTIIGPFIGLHSMAVGVFIAAAGYVVVRKSVESIISSDCIPGLESGN